MDLTIYTIAYNEEVLLQFFIDHYRSRFPNCRIVINDNYSTDSTEQIALKNNCEVVKYFTNNQIQDSRYLQIKNNCWKSATTDWILICDIDELLEINSSDLDYEASIGTTIIDSKAYNMVNMFDNYDLPNIKHGARCSPYDKNFIFNKKFITEINYAPGCHTCSPIGQVNHSEKTYLLYHYICIHPDLQVSRYQSYAKRLCPENITNGWGYQYLKTEQEIRHEFQLARTYVERIIP